MWDMRVRHGWFGKAVWQVGWLNRAGFGPVFEGDYAEAKSHFDHLTALPKKFGGMKTQTP